MIMNTATNMITATIYTVSLTPYAKNKTLTYTESMTLADKLVAILLKSHDGAELDPRDLYWHREAVTENLTETGMALFEELWNQIAAGMYQYRPPW
jgi:hypothetical protein